jgi:hypothetical protein
VLEIFGDDSCVGAQVVVDSVVQGEMKAVSVDGAHFSTSLRNGTHRIELRKPGFETSVQIINVPTNSEHYLQFSLAKAATQGGGDGG